MTAQTRTHQPSTMSAPDLVVAQPRSLPQDLSLIHI